MILAIASAMPVAARGATLRVVTYNIDSSDIHNNNNLPDVTTVLQGIGAHHMAGNVEAPDVIGLTELLDTNDNTITSSTLPALVADLNGVYGAGTYAYDNTPDPTTGGTNNGPSGLIYNTHKVSVVSATFIGSIGGSSPPLPPRAPMRYLLQPVGYGADSRFYMYVSHYKAGSDSTSQTRRGVEATEIRQDADALGSNAHILYTGDFNATQGASDPSYQTLIGAGTAQASDPADPTHTWTNSSNTWKYLYSESTTSLGSRFDFQLLSSAVLNQPGLQLAPDTTDPFPAPHYLYAYKVFGNNGTTALNGATNTTSNTSVGDLVNPSPATVKAALAAASDHLPFLADYNLVGVATVPVTRYYVGPAAGTWNTTSSWSETDHGNAGAFVPRDGDTAIVDPTVDTTISYNGAYAGGLAELDLNATGGATASLNQSANALAVTTLLAIGNQPGTRGAYALSGGTATAANIVLGSTGAGGGVGSMIWAGGTLNTTGVTLNHGSTMTLGSGAGLVLKTNTLSIDTAGSAELDLKDNKAIVRSTPIGSWNGSAYTGITGLIQSGRNGGNWNGGGIVTSQSAAIGSNFTTLAVARGSEVKANTVSETALWAGQTITGTDTLVMYTYGGDANLDGKINIDDYVRIDTGIAGGLTGWSNGDFNYDGKVNIDDYSTIIDVNIGNQNGIFPTAGGVAAVPEPITSALLILPAAAIMLRRCRRRGQVR